MLTDQEKETIEDFLRVLNEHGHAAAEYLNAQLDLDENEEAACWLAVVP